MKKLFAYILCLLIIVCPVFNSWAAGPYYIDKTLGNDGNDGLSGDDEGGGVGPWQTLAMIDTANIGAGEDVYLKCGETWTGEDIDVNYDGVDSNNYSIVGAYYMNGSTETIGVSGAKPIIYGAADYSYPASSSALVDGSTRDYVRFENLHIQYSGGYCFHNSWGATQTLNNIDCDHTQNIGITIGGASTIVEYCTIQHFALMEAPTPASPWPSGLNLEGAHNSIARYNSVGDGYGEGIGAVDTTGIQIYNNYVYDTYSIGIYLNASSTATVYNNLIVGTNDTTYLHYTSPDYHGPGLKVQIESGYSRACIDNKIFNNIVINRYEGLAVQNAKNDPLYDVDDNTFVNNTFIDNQYNVHIYNADDNLNLAGTVFANNLSYNNHADVSANVSIVTNDVDNWTADYNAWTGLSGYDDGSETGLSGAHDVTADPTFAMAVWRGSDALNNETFVMSDLMPTANVVDVGDSSVGADYDDAFRSSSSKPPTAATTGDQDDYGSSWEIGAVIYEAGAPPAAKVIIISRGVNVGVIPMM